MRIISGTLRGRVLKVPERPGLRPSQDRLRGGLFSALESVVDLTGALTLDLYAGSGSLGIEAISRGARESVFIESDRQTAIALKGNLERFGIAESCQVITGELPGELAALRGYLEKGEGFQVVFADPPYADSCLDLPELLCKHKIVLPGSILIFECRKGAPELTLGAGGLELKLLKERKYGDSVVRFYIFE